MMDQCKDVAVLALSLLPSGFGSQTSRLWTGGRRRAIENRFAVASSNAALYGTEMELLGCLAGDMRGNIGAPANDLKTNSSLDGVSVRVGDRIAHVDAKARPRWMRGFA